jgi:hypothetical protein
MADARQLSILLTLIVMGLLLWHLFGHRTPDAQDEPARRRQKVAHEIRALAVAISGPCAAAMWFGYLSSEYALPLALFLMAGLLVAEQVAPTRLRDRR